METTRDISAEELAALRDPGARHGAFDRLIEEIVASEQSA